MDTLRKVHDNSPLPKVGISTIFRQKCGLHLNWKVTRVSKVLEEELAMNGIHFIHNSNIFLVIYGRMDYILMMGVFVNFLGI